MHVERYGRTFSCRPSEREAQVPFHAALGSAVVLLLLAAPAVAQQREIILATTTSTLDTGLLDSLLPRFRRATGITVKPIGVGTGAALDMARRGDADAVLVHAPDAEREYVQRGDLIGGRRIMHNDFLVIGPASDPARVRRQPDAAAAMKAIAAHGSFVSRGDGSGTEKKELALWKAAGVDPASMPRREETGQGMGATLLVAEARQTYTLTDRGTYLAFKGRLTLVPLREGDATLRNVYHAYVVNPGKHPTVRRAAAERFVRFLTEPETQAWIGEFGRATFGQPLFVPDAGRKSPSTRQRSARAGAGLCSGPAPASHLRATAGRRESPVSASPSPPSASRSASPSPPPPPPATLAAG